MTTLPDRNTTAEDAFVDHWSKSTDTQTLMELISNALEHRRPMLAARLVNLLDDHLEVEPGSPIEKARNAARMMVRSREQPNEQLFNALDEAWREARNHRMWRIKQRMRSAMSGKQKTFRRLDSRRSKRRS